MSVQNRYGLEVRAAADEEVLRLCGERGIAFVPFFSIAGRGAERGRASAPSAPDVAAAVSRVAEAHGATPAQVRLAWTLHRGPHVLAIPGTGDPVHLAENVAAAALRLAPDELASLEAVAVPQA